MGELNINDIIVSEETCSLAMTLTKGDLVDSIYSQVGLSITKSVKAVESLLEIIEKILENREDVELSSLRSQLECWNSGMLE